MRDLLAGGRSRRLDDEALFRDADRIGQLAALQPARRRCNAVTTSVRLSTSSDARRQCDGSGQRSPNCPLARAGAWLGTHIRPWPPVIALAFAAPPPISRARRLQLDHDGQAVARAASLDLIWVAFLFDASPFRPRGTTMDRSA